MYVRFTHPGLYSHVGKEGLADWQALCVHRLLARTSAYRCGGWVMSRNRGLLLLSLSKEKLVIKEQLNENGIRTARIVWVLLFHRLRHHLELTLELTLVYAQEHKSGPLQFFVTQSAIDFGFLHARLKVCATNYISTTRVLSPVDFSIIIRKIRHRWVKACRYPEFCRGTKPASGLSFVEVSSQIEISASCPLIQVWVEP